MPYNNTPIQPSQEVTGQVSLPLARVKKIIAADDDISNCSNNAAFVITVAAEMFLQHLTEQTHNIVKSGGVSEGGRNAGKPRRNIQYRDVANAVARVENLEFLADVVPKTTTYRNFKQKQNQNATSISNTTTTGGAQQPLPQAQPQPQQMQPNGPPAHTLPDPIAQSTLDTHMAAPTSRIPVIEPQQQATNGASPIIEVPRAIERDEMDVDVVDRDDTEEIIEDDGDEGTEEGSMHTANDGDEVEGVGSGGGAGDAMMQ